MPQKLTTEEFIKKAVIKHKDTYSYKKVKYKNAKEKVIIICKTHGDFNITPNNHLSGQGCIKCRNASIGDKLKLDPAIFIDKAIKKHGDSYDYTNTLYVKAGNKVTITHKECNTTFSILPNNHLRNKGGCPTCSEKYNLDRLLERSKVSANSFIENLKKSLGDDYEALTPYVAARKKISILHKTCGSTFSASPDTLLRKHGCPSCASHGFDPSKPGILYYLSINNGEYFKIGITNRSVAERFKAYELPLITVVYQHTFENGIDAYSAEQSILKDFKQHLASNVSILHSGNTEIFNTNILPTKDLYDTYVRNDQTSSD